jgi:hypothetical protein
VAVEFDSGAGNPRLSVSPEQRRAAKEMAKAVKS